MAKKAILFFPKIPRKRIQVKKLNGDYDER